MENSNSKPTPLGADQAAALQLAQSRQSRASRPRRRRRAMVLIVLITLVLGGGVAAWSRIDAEIQAADGNSLELTVVEVGMVETSVNASCTVESNRDVEIKCRASGEVVQLPYDIGDSVRQGELICQLDPTDEQLSVRSAEAAVEQSEARLAQARVELQEAEENLKTVRARRNAELESASTKADYLRAKADRQQELIDQQLGSKEEWETAETEAVVAKAARKTAEIAIDELKQHEIQLEYLRQAVNVAEAQVAADRIGLQTQRQQLAYTTVNAPVDGVVSSLDVQMGAIVASGTGGFSGGTTIMTISDLSRVFVVATVDESDIGQVRAGQAARVTVASFPDRVFAGEVVRIAVTGVNESDVVTFEVKIEIVDESRGLLRPEMTGNATIIQDSKSNVLTLPSSAVTSDGNRTVVTLPDGRDVPVTIGLVGDESLEILSGLSAGDRVVVPTMELPTRWKNEETRRGPPSGP